MEELYDQPRHPIVESIVRHVYSLADTVGQDPVPEAEALAQPFGRLPMTSFSEVIPWVQCNDLNQAETLHLIHYNAWTRDYLARSIPREILAVRSLADTAAIWYADSPLSFAEVVYTFRVADQLLRRERGKRPSRDCFIAYELLGLCAPVICSTVITPEGQQRALPVDLIEVLRCRGSVIPSLDDPEAPGDGSDRGPITYIPYGPGTLSAGSVRNE